MRRQGGFTLIELLVTISISALLLSFGAFAVRHYWLVRSLEGARDEVVTQLRGQQQKVIAETHPLVYGARFQVGSSTWGLLRYNGVSGGSCTEYQTLSFDGGVYVESANFASTTGVSGCPGSASSSVFFFGRGSATQGTLTLRQDAIGRSRSVTVTGITGRVDGG